MLDSSSTGDSGSGGTALADGGSPASTGTVEPSSSGAIDQTTGSPDQAPGPVPYDRFSEVNTKYGALRWAEGLNSERVQQQQRFFQWLDSDPEGAFKYMEDYLTRAGALKRQQAAASPEDTRPQPDVVVPETGQKFYSAEAAERLSQWIARQATQPLETRLQSIEGNVAHGRVAAQAQAQIAEAASWPYFSDHIADISKAMDADGRLSLEGAYRRVVVPRIKQLERDAVLKEINQKSQASTHNPGSRTSAQSQSESKLSWTELFKRELGKRGGV